MADNLIQKSHKNSDKTKFNNVVHRTTSESLRLSEPEKSMTHPNSLQSSHNPRKISSFQITSVTVGSRVSTDAGEDSADDLDESHTDDISRVTDIENETPSFSEDTFSKDDVFYNASSAPLGCAPVIPTSSQYGLAIVGQDNISHIQGTAPNANNSDVNDMHVNVSNAASGSIINIIGNAKPQEGMKEINEHVRNERFKVVKIESTEPFKRGRWLCMDYLDHTTTQPNPAIVVNNNIEVTETSTLPVPDSGVVIADIQIDDITNSMDKTPKDIQLAPTGPPKQMEPSAVKQYAGASPGQSLTQPMNIAQQQIVPPQGVSMQSPPMEIPQQIPQQSMQNTQQVAQPHPQSMTHITLQNAPNHAPPPSAQNVQQIPQSFPQHQLQQVIAQTQGMTMQQIPMHQQMPQQMQQIQNQAQMQQMNTQHLTQAQMPAMQQMSQQIPQMQAMTNQAQLQQVPAQQMQMPNAQQLHQMQQGQLNNMSTTHHMQNQAGQPPQLQHMASQPQMQTIQTQQIPNHLQQIQMANTQQMNQIQPQIHQQMQTQAQGQQQVVTNMHPQMQQQPMGGVQTQYNQAVQQPNPQAMMNQGIPSSQPAMVPTQHNVSQYHPQPTQINQQGQTLPQEVLSSIAGSQQGATLPANIQSMPPQQQGTTMPNNLQGMATQQQGATMPNNLQGMATQQQNAPVHAMAQQGQSLPQGQITMITPQNMTIMDGNQGNLQIPVSDAIYIQSASVGQQMTMAQHIPQAQNMMPQQVSGGVQYMVGTAQGASVNVSMPQVSMANVPQQQQIHHPQNIPMSIQQTMPVALPGGVHAGVVQSQTNMQPAVGMSYNNVVPVMSQNSVTSGEAGVSGTSSPVVSLPVSSAPYVQTQPVQLDSQNFGSPVNTVVSHVPPNMVNSGLGIPITDCGATGETVGDGSQGPPTDNGDGKEENQATGNEDESASGTSAVAIDNKIEQAMDLVKSHLMFAVREEVEVLKERIAELMDRITQLEVENTYLRAHASQDTLAQLPTVGNKPAALPPAGPPPPVS